MKLELSTVDHLPEIVSCHKDAFPNALSTKQGDAFISKMMEWYVKSERGIIFHVIDDEGKMAGYCGGIITRMPGMLGAVSSISQYAFACFLKSYMKKPWLLFHNENIKKFPYIFKNILLKLGLKPKVKRVSETNKNKFQPFMGLVVIGVKNNYQGKGYGSALLQEFERLARMDGEICKIQLSVKASNNQAVRSYLRNGWQVVKENDQTKQLMKLI